MGAPLFDSSEQNYQYAIEAFQSALGCLKRCELHLDSLPKYKRNTRIQMMSRRLEIAKKALTVPLDYSPFREDGTQLQGGERMASISEPLDRIEQLLDEVRDGN